MLEWLRPSAAIVLFLGFFLTVGAQAQDTGTIHGAVTDSTSGEVLPGVNVVVQGLNVGSATNAQGQYTISEVPAGSHTLTASFVGYDRKEILVEVSSGETVQVDIPLVPSEVGMEELVVQGYRLEEQGIEATGATSVVTGEITEEANVQTATEALQGRVSGARITSTSGQPGAGFRIQIRGQGTITAGDQPLYIVDGVQINAEGSSTVEADLSPLAGINPNNIESIRVLKDASATAIYGARASNGVVLITTESGTAGDTQVNFTAQMGSLRPLRDFDLLTPSQWAAYTYTMAENAGYTREQIANSYNISSTNPEEVTGPQSYRNWYDAVTRPPLTQSYNLSFSGGTETTSFRVSGNYERDRGQYIDSKYNQQALQFSLDHDLAEDLSVGTKINLSRVEVVGTSTYNIGSPTFYAAGQIRPHHPVYQEPGNPESGYYYDLTGPYNVNLVAQSEYNDRSSVSTQLIGNLNLTWNIAPWLTARTVTGLDYSDVGEERRLGPRLPQNQNGGTKYVDASRAYTVNLSQTLNYDFVLEDVHSISGLLGAEYKNEYSQFASLGGQNFPIYLYQNVANTSEPISATETDTESRILSFFGEGEYEFDERYVLRGTMRYDGSSRFGSDTRFGLFGSVGGAWRIANEAFMDVGFVNSLELRGSYGVLGNSEIGNFVARRLYGGAGTYRGQPAIAPSSLGNPNLTWEESRQLNLGLDYRLFGGRISGAFNVYRTISDELLLSRSLPSVSGFGSTIVNAGALENEGIEIELSTINLDVGEFRWDTNFNISFQRSEVLELTGDNQELYAGGQPGGSLYRVGEPPAQYEKIPWAGVNPADGRPLYRDADGNLTYYLQGGDAYQPVGNNLADFYGGLGNTFSYSGLTLDVLFQFDYGRDVMNTDRYFIDGASSNGHTTAVLDYWEEPGDVAPRPMPHLGPRSGGSAYNSGYFQSTVFFEDASYIRLKQLRLSYQLPSALTKSIGMQGASIFAQGTNLLTFTNYTGIDPEQSGEATGQYPQSKTLTGGINVTF